jgi:ankyrin repeat protein
LSIFLIEQGANINYKTSPKEDYPLLIACRYGLEDVIKKLLLYDNIDINCLNKDNETCYTILLNNLNVTIYNLIIDYVKQKKNNDKNRKNNKSEHDNNINISKNNNKKKIMIKSLSFDSPLEYINSKNCKYILYYIICLNNIFFKFF